MVAEFITNRPNSSVRLLIHGEASMLNLVGVTSRRSSREHKGNSRPTSQTHIVQIQAMLDEMQSFRSLLCPMTNYLVGSISQLVVQQPSKPHNVKFYLVCRFCCSTLLIGYRLYSSIAAFVSFFRLTKVVLLYQICSILQVIPEIMKMQYRYRERLAQI